MIIETKCYICGKEIYIYVTKNSKECSGFSCNNCVSKDSLARNGIDESVCTEFPLTHIIRKLKQLRKNYGTKIVCKRKKL